MHTGSIDGMRALIGLMADRLVGVSVLANSDHAELRHALMYRVFDLYRGHADRDWSTELRTLYDGIQTRALAARRQQETRRTPDTRPSVPLDRFAGTYVHPTYGTAQVSVRDGALHFAFGTRAAALTHWHYDTFQARWDDVRMQPSLIVFTADGVGGISDVRAFGINFVRAPR